jgi:hypothetical protein
MPIQKITSGIIQDGAIVAADIASVNGSVITANTIANSAIQTGAVENYMRGASLDFGMRNRIINGAMVIDQRNAGAAVTATTYCPDRWRVENVSDASFSAQQVSDAPTGFVKSLKWTTTTADASLAAGQYALVRQGIEGYNTADLMWGTASAATITVSFWVKSTLTGTFGATLSNTAFDRSYPFTYTISVANTWEYKTITIPGDTTGTWEITNNSAGIQLYFGLGTGSTYSGTAGAWAASGLLSVTSAVSVIGTLNATWQITGVQFEKGSTATAFDYRPFGTELALCQRYYYQELVSLIASGIAFDTIEAQVRFQYPVQMRISPTVTIYDNSNNAARMHRNRSGDHANAVTIVNPTSLGWPTVSSTGLTAGGGYSCKVKADAEL